MPNREDLAYGHVVLGLLGWLTLVQFGINLTPNRIYKHNITKINKMDQYSEKLTQNATLMY